MVARRCFFCQKGQFTVCDVSNPPFEEPAYSNTMEKLYGDRIAGMHGYRCGCRDPCSRHGAASVA